MDFGSAAAETGQTGKEYMTSMLTASGSTHTTYKEHVYMNFMRHRTELFYSMSASQNVTKQK